MPRQKIEPPKQLRSQETMRRVIEAAEKLLSKKTVDKVTIREILRTANVSTGSFYARFPSKESLWVEIWQEFKDSMDDFPDGGFASLSGANLETRIRYVIEFRVKRFHKYRGLFRAFREMIRTGALPTARRDRELYAQSRDRHIAFLLECKDEISHSDPTSAIEFADYVTIAAAREMLLYPKSLHASTVKRTHAELIDQLTLMFLKYLK